MKVRRRSTSFGFMRSYKTEGALAGDFEFMCFVTPGKPHRHDKIEIAICIAGSGSVVIGEREVYLAEGDFVEIGCNLSHYMIPDASLGMEMMILYREEN